ncbi:hypothetical protein HK100_003983 [Physocladia obscura]|uniref:Peptidase A1 domain-containing protein n=1 Tax=Physocladia obscura TaxID=109957 RepID=A0AAD5T7J1_9FUNG|nr:hypothetical protein HK100_003983 [Physocladia obscura]
MKPRKGTEVLVFVGFIAVGASEGRAKVATQKASQTSTVDYAADYYTPDEYAHTNAYHTRPPSIMSTDDFPVITDDPTISTDDYFSTVTTTTRISPTTNTTQFTPSTTEPVYVPTAAPVSPAASATYAASSSNSTTGGTFKIPIYARYTNQTVSLEFVSLNADPINATIYQTIYKRQSGFYTTITLGTPQQSFVVDVDTGSSVS